jgi:8-hydroxy-5-deazaflavin:NADPH oxidoreductase
MKVGVLGTGMVGNALGSKLVELGHEVTMGARESGNESAVAWAGEAGEAGHESSFAGAAEFGELIINATAGTASLAALERAGAENLDGKVLIDVANPLDPDAGSPPPLAFCNTESLGERIQIAFPGARVVKALNTVNAAVMVEPARLGEPTSIFLCGEDPDAKAATRELLEALGWKAEQIVDLGGIAAARGTEMYLPLWLRLMSTIGNPFFNVRVVRGE